MFSNPKITFLRKILRDPGGSELLTQNVFNLGERAKLAFCKGGWIGTCLPCVWQHPASLAAQESCSQTVPSKCSTRPKKEAALWGKSLKDWARGGCAWEGPVRVGLALLCPLLTSGDLKGSWCEMSVACGSQQLLVRLDLERASEWWIPLGLYGDWDGKAFVQR